MSSDYLVCIGVNTGNSLDAADVVLTKFGTDGSIVDLSALSVQMPSDLGHCLRVFRSVLMECGGNMETAMPNYDRQATKDKLHIPSANELIRTYTLYVADAINRMKETVKNDADRAIDLIGFHGQTCAHQPPSIAREGASAYTVQIGDGQLLADETGLPVVYDFRSDDLMNGGEAAPLAPVHHEHLARHLRARGKFPIAFCNAGNTGNISVITERPDKSVVVFGWDVGPFNDYPDKLMQAERGQPCDSDGKVGSQGKVNVELLKILFERGAVTDHGENFLLQPPPKSSDPQWYRLLPELVGTANVGERPLAFEDRLRTAEYFSAYVYFYSLKWVAEELVIPACFALCGGGWNNPICRGSFENLLRGEFDKSLILPEHQELFEKISKRLRETGNQIEVKMSDDFGFSGQYMEARIFADAAMHRIMGESFSRPETTGCRNPTILGILRFPSDKIEAASENLRSWITRYRSADLTQDKREIFDGRWSRAALGWETRGKLSTRA